MLYIMKYSNCVKSERCVCRFVTNVKYVKWTSPFVKVCRWMGGGVVSNTISYSSERPVPLRYWSSSGRIDGRSWIRWFHQSPVVTSASPRIMTVSISIIVCGGAQICINNSDNTPLPTLHRVEGRGGGLGVYECVCVGTPPQLTGWKSYWLGISSEMEGKRDKRLGSGLSTPV